MKVLSFFPVKEQGSNFAVMNRWTINAVSVRNRNANPIFKSFCSSSATLGEFSALTDGILICTILREARHFNANQALQNDEPERDQQASESINASREWR